MTQNSNQDPYSGYGSPQNPYGAPPPQDPYSVPPPQTPYGAYQPQNPSGAPPPQDAYGAPPQSPYGPPPGYGQAGYGYGAPPQGPYGPQPWYGAANAAIGYGPGPSAPLPLGEAIRQLPNQYIKVLTKPSAETFTEEMRKANWDIVWTHLLGYAFIVCLLGLISALFAPSIINSMGSPNSATASMSTFIVATSVGSAFSQIVFVPLFFFAGVAIQYIVAKAFNGQGTFLAQSYTALLYQVPLNTALRLIAIPLVLIPIAGAFIALALDLAVLVYSIVLNVFQIMATHRLSGGKATGVVLIPYAVLVLLFFLCLLTSAAFIFTLLRQAH